MVHPIQQLYISMELDKFLFVKRIKSLDHGLMVFLSSLSAPLTVKKNSLTNSLLEDTKTAGIPLMHHQERIGITVMKGHKERMDSKEDSS